jgi:peptidyl-tRNA hydrolase, PTH1 family
MSLFRRARDNDESDRWVVVGLGNPGPRYEDTRHNVGVQVVEELLDRNRVSLKRHKSGCLTAETNVSGTSFVLARSTSFMNESGRPVGQLLRWYKVAPARLIVVHDELDIPFPQVRIKDGGGTAGHNGVSSIATHLGTKDFLRVRVGVSRPRGRQDPADYVLSSFSASERKELDGVVGNAADAVERILEAGSERAMNEFNTRG